MAEAGGKDGSTNLHLILLSTFLLLLLIPIFLLFSCFNFNLNHLFKSSIKVEYINPTSITLLLSKPSQNHGRFLSTSSTRTNKVSSGLRRIEKDLAEARVAIRKAIDSKNYTSDRVETFVPAGPIYRNSYAFHQSHIEMVKRLKVWTYTEGDQPLVHDGPMNDIYGIEGQFIDEIESQKNPFRASSPEEAHIFFLPFTVANVIQFVYKPILHPSDYSRARLQGFTTDYVKTVASKHPYWNRSNGADHFMVSCHDWAPDISKKDPQLYKNFIRVLCNANTSENFRPDRDVSLPEINIPHGKLRPPSKGQPASKRSILAFFAGGAHGDIRNILFDHWENKDDEVVVYRHFPKKKNYFKMLGSSKFCLCPSGYEVASPREVEAISSGCVPVIISSNYSLPFNDVLDWSKFSIQIPVEKISEIKSILKKISFRRYLVLYKRVNMVKRHFEMNRPTKPFDVIHMVLHSVWLRRLNIALPT